LNGIDVIKNVPMQPIQQDISANIQKPLEIIAASSSTTQDFLRKLAQLYTTAQKNQQIHSENCQKRSRI